jgi:hypothetical protein
MTVTGNMIRCDARGCRTKSVLQSISVISPDYVRVRYAQRGWTTTSDEKGETDYCPTHSAS